MAADGNGSMNSSVAGSFPYPFPMPTARTNKCGAVCEPGMWSLRARLEPWRHALGVWRFVRNGGTGNLSVVKDATLSLFAAGVGQSGTASGLVGVTLTEADTNALQEGALVEQGMWWTTVGMLVSFGAPWNIDDATNMDVRRFATNLQSYATRLIRGVADAMSFELLHGQEACKYSLSPPSMWGAAASVSPVPNSVQMPGTFWFTAAPDCSTGATDPMKLGMTATLRHLIQVDNDAGDPTTTDVAVPFRVQLVGYPECMPGAGKITQSERDAIKAEILADLKRGG